MTATLSAGPRYTLTTAVVYALPPKVVRVAVYSAAGTISVSVDGTNWVVVTLDDNDEFVTAAQFIRANTGDATVSVKTE